MIAHPKKTLALLAGLLVSATACHAQINPKVVIERDVKYGAAGERALLLDVVRPRETPKEPMPVVVFVHGGGWAGGDRKQGVPLLVPLAEEGYFCVSVGYRLTGEAIWPAQIHDCKAAVRWLRANAKKYHLNPDKIGAWGGSAGGHLAAMLGTSGGVKELEGSSGSPGQSSRVACVLNWFGPTDLVAAWKDPTVAGWVKALLDKLAGGPAAEKLEVLRAASPVTYVTKDDPPILTMHGTKDAIVPIAQARILDEAMKKAGADSTLVVVEGGGHGFGGQEVFARVRAFFARHLRGREVEVSAEPIGAGKK